METRSNIIASALDKGEMKTVIDLCVPGTETDTMIWYADVAKKYNVFKIAIFGAEPAVTVQAHGDTRGGSALVLVIYTRQGTRIESAAFAEANQPIPSQSNSNPTFELPLFWVKDAWGNWVLDGKRTAVGKAMN
jgi:hypothetical protein